MQRILLTIVAAGLTAAIVDQVMARRGWLPPRFIDQPWRRWLGSAILAFLFWLGMFGSFAITDPPELPDQLSIPSLFQMHALLLLVLAIWWMLGFAQLPGPKAGFARQFGLSEPKLIFEIALGGLGACVAWLVAIAAMAVAVGILTATGMDQVVPTGPPKVVLLLAAMPWLARLALAISAGVFEEMFFRGFLQPRVGIGLSTALFVLAHASYGQPMMLVGVTVLSLIFALFVRYRQSIWAAAAAHAGFDAIQLLIILPLATKLSGA